MIASILQWHDQHRWMSGNFGFLRKNLTGYTWCKLLGLSTPHLEHGRITRETDTLLLLKQTRLNFLPTLQLLALVAGFVLARYSDTRQSVERTRFELQVFPVLDANTLVYKAEPYHTLEDGHQASPFTTTCSETQWGQVDSEIRVRGVVISSFRNAYQSRFSNLNHCLSFLLGTKASRCTEQRQTR